MAKPMQIADTFEHEIINAMCPGTFFQYEGVYKLIEGLGSVKAKIDKLVASDPRKGLDLLETFIREGR